MILSIPDVLTPAELESLNQALEKAQFADGRATASGAAARAKSNRQVSPKDPALPTMQKTVLYSACTVHRVEPVTRGTRLAAVAWVQSMVREPERRQLLVELGTVRKWVERQSPEAREGLQLQKIRAQLMRWWSEV